MKIILFPFKDWIRTYNKAYLKGDLTAGLTVGIMLIPQGMAYAMLAGLPPIYGLYASTLPLIIYALMGTSRQLAVGPVAMVSLLIIAGVGGLAEPGSAAFIEMAILLALIVGAIQLLMGLFRLGFIVNFLSHPVVSGFTSAAALIIGFSQLKHLLGFSLPRDVNIFSIIGQAISNIDQTHLTTVLIGTMGIIVILTLRKFNRAIPGALISVLLSILVVYLFSLDSAGVQIVGTIPSGLPAFKITAFNFQQVQQLLPVALTIALIGYMESIAVARAIQRKHKDYKVNANQELIGLGLANIVGSFFQSFPTTGGFSRTAVNDQSGAKTGMASVFSAILVVITLLFITPLFYYLPNAILASVIMVAVFGLIDYKEAVNLWKTDKTDFLLLLTTFLVTLVLGVEIGIGTGVILSLVMVIYRSTYPHIAVLGKIPSTKLYRNVARFPDAQQPDNFIIIRIDAQLFFANTSYIRDKVDALINERPSIKVLILSMEAVSAVDSSAIHSLKDLIDDYRRIGLEVCLVGAIGPVRDSFYKSHFIEYIGKQHFFNFVQDAVDYYSADADTHSTPSRIALQTDIEDQIELIS